MFNPSRDEARRFLTEAWAKYRAQAPLSDLEKIAAALIGLHPEYHATFEQPERFADRDYAPEHGDVNPFLHLSLHLAVAEQLAIDQPPGIRAHFDAPACGTRRRTRGIARGDRLPGGSDLAGATAADAAGRTGLSRLPANGSAKREPF